MRYVDDFYDYKLLDCSSGEKLESWGGIILIRPDPQIIWQTPKEHEGWQNAHARYIRSDSGGGYWEKLRRLPEVWQVKYRDLAFNIKPTGFKHMGLFPEHATNWNYISDKIKERRQRKGQVKVLNLFAYTGGSTIAAAKALAEVCHVDAAKGMITWAKENAVINNLSASPIRYIVDDCMKFVAREVRRGNKYDAVIMDPPSYGRGPSGEIWRMEDKIYQFLILIRELISDNPLFIMLNSYTGGLSPTVIRQLMALVFNGYKNIFIDEIGLRQQNSDFVLPCGSTCLCEFSE